MPATTTPSETKKLKEKSKKLQIKLKLENKKVSSIEKELNKTLKKLK
jgi:hypothetical protein